MKISEIQLNHFKRFTHTTIKNIPCTARLILLVGPNGCGKSSLIEAAHTWHRHHWNPVGGWDKTYHAKQVPGMQIDWQNSISVSFHDPQPSSPDEKIRAIYARSAYRNEAEFQLSQLSRVGPVTDEQRIHRLIDNDQAVSLNYRRLVSQGFESVFEHAPSELTIGQFRKQTLGQIREATLRLFPNLTLNSLGNPLNGGTFRFDKGDSKGFLYKNLSGGEKAAFDLLLDIIVKKDEFSDTVFFIDEPEAHIATALQGALLKEMYDLVPASSQLWLATHSIGMMRCAIDMARRSPGEVVFLDFDGVQFDLPQELSPIEPSRPFWKRAMQIALDEFAGYVAPEQVVLCEGGRLAGAKDFDADCYNAIFADARPHTMFLGAGNSSDIENDPKGLVRLVGALVPDVSVIRVIDRDDRTETEIAELQVRGIRVLTLRTIESYLLDDEVLTALCISLGKQEAMPALLEAKSLALRASVDAGGPQDDLKRVAGDIYNAAKRLFPEKKLGSDNRAFMRGICAGLLKRGMAIYARLESDIFGA